MATVVGNDGNTYETTTNTGPGTFYVGTPNGEVLVNATPVSGSWVSPFAGGGASQGGRGSGGLVDPSTGRPAWTGPQGQPGSATPFPGGTATYTMPDGRVAYYDPNAAPAPGNVAALKAYGGGGAGGGKTGGGTDPTGQQDALAVIQQAFAQDGITDPQAIAWAQNLITNGGTAAQIEVQMYDQPWFKARFPGIFIRQQNGLPPISPADYINYEDQARQLESAAGLPRGFLDNADFIGSQIGKDTSMAELQDRVEKGFAVVQTAPQATRDAFAQMFGARGDAALAAYVLDQSRSVPLLEQQVAGAQMMGAGTQQGFAPTSGQAMQMAAMGISPDQATSGFSQLAQERPFFTQGVGETEHADINTTGVNAQFGLDAASALAVQRLQAQRKAEFEGGGGAVSDSFGAVGAGQQKPF